MQGRSKRSARIALVAVFAGAFFAGAALIFWLTSAAGQLSGVAALPWRRRLSIAALVLFLLAVVDLVAIARASYCPISWRRQTPRALMRRHGIRFVALAWGFDTGLLVTTFRVAAIGWGALFLCALGLSRAWTGIGYGLGFTIPFLLLLVRPQLGRASRNGGAEDPGLESMLGRRALLQGASAVVLSASGVILMV